MKKLAFEIDCGEKHCNNTHGGMCDYAMACEGASRYYCVLLDENLEYDVCGELVERCELCVDASEEME